MARPQVHCHACDGRGHTESRGMPTDQGADTKQVAAVARLARDDSPERLLVADDAVRVGSSADNDIVLEDEGVAGRHLSLAFRHRCWLLRVEPGAERVHVNARPVHELALLRLGDCISVGGRKLYLLPLSDDVPDAILETAPRKLASAPAVTGLRGVAGPLSGRFLPIRSDLLLDSHNLPGVSGCVRLRLARRGASFEWIGEGGPSPACNGVRCSRGALGNGDQLAWGRNRFVLEAIALLPDATPDEPSRRAADAAASGAEPEPAGHEMAWLLGAAAALAALIALLLLLRS